MDRTYMFVLLVSITIRQRSAHPLTARLPPLDGIEDERLHADVVVDRQFAQAPVSLWDKQITQAMREAAQ
jgi:hypothetical protein